MPHEVLALTFKMSSSIQSTRLRCLTLAAVLTASLTTAHAAEHITLANGFELDCVRHEPLADNHTVRLYPVISGGKTGEATSYLDLPSSAIRLVEPLPEILSVVSQSPQSATAKPVVHVSDIDALLISAGTRRHIDVDLLASLVNAESGGHAGVVSRAGARGVMQLMPATAAAMGVHDSFRAEDNIAGGTLYLDQMLTRYHDDIALALAAYNAGPGAVDRFHGVPPFRETRAYVTRIINEFNRRKRLTLQAATVQALTLQH